MLKTVRQSGGESVESELRALLVEVLGLAPARVAGFNASTGLFGSLPEFDSLAVANFLTGFEERFGVLIEDHDVEAEDFATFARLLAWAERLVTFK